jgi:hypothetical protein
MGFDNINFLFKEIKVNFIFMKLEKIVTYEADFSMTREVAGLGLFCIF